ncbi:restriction endonuclease subunit S [Clostridium sp. DFI.5.61]|jgi:restriction endonuclease S subunit|uniref:restriction endonuclease subunit S n=1 Tax=Clostridium sp. DFI.5.61 TaxID=2965279 RepID=UPI00210DDA99|nr:restriction endonuclease subunit S [Clostridium sp. DFI.5.61]MCB5925870.1 restriction endonuclease subunit S [bacterium 210820-DFI.5.26]MCQ5157991.1 restriction endonuclease subunit S [Clostridium sp. DFI.5.61]
MLFFKQCPVSYNTTYEKIGDEVRSLADEVPFDIPDSWEWVRLGNISSYAETKQKVNATSADPSIWGLDLEDIEKGGRLLEYKTVGERKAVGDKTVFTKGDILYSKLRPYLLKILVAPDDGICTPEIVPFRVYGGIDPSYIVNYLKSPYVDNLINSITYGVKMPRVGTETMTSLLVPIPPLEEQRRIVEKIDEVASAVSAYDVAYQKSEALNSTFPEALKKSILQEAVQGKLVPQDSSDEPAEALLERIRAEKQRLIKEGKIKKDKHESVIFRRDNSHYEKRGSEEVCIDDEIPFEVPPSWALIRLDDIGIYRKGPFGSSLTKSMFVPKGADTVKVYEQKNAIQKDHTLGTYYITRQYYESKMRSFTVEPGDILVSCAGTIGETYVLPEQIELGIINQALMRMTIFAPIDLDYFLLYFDYVLKQTAKESSKGSAIKNIPPFEIFKKLILPLPPLEEQKRIVEKVRELESLCNSLCS